MSNFIKSGTTLLTSYVKGNVRVGVDGETEYGPTENTGFYNGITPPVGGYTIYVLKEFQGPSIHVAYNDTDCIFYLKSFGSTGSTISDVLSWADVQSNIWVTSSDLTANDIFVNDGLVLKLDASDLSSYPTTGTIWYDLAGTQQNVTLYNTPTFTSGIPSYFTFNGTNEYGLGSGSVLPTTGYTKSVWVYLNGYQDNNMVSGDGHFMFMGANPSVDRKIYCGHSDWGSYVAYPSTSTIDLNTWYNITLTFNTTDGMKLYINGVLDSTYTINKNPHPGSGTINVGTFNGGNLLNGRIAKVYCHNRSLTSTEVQQIYNLDKSEFISPTPTPTPTRTSTPTPTPTNTPTPTPTNTPAPINGLQFYLQTAPSSGTVWTDSTGNGKNATINGDFSYVSNNGGGIKLNNTDYTGTGYISVPYNISSNTATIEIVASFNPTSHWATIWGNEAYSFSRGYFAYMPNSTSIVWGSPTSNTTSVSITASNTIRHWVFVINGTTKTLYLNGSQFATATTNNPTGGYATSEFLFGARHTNAGTGATDKLNNTNSANQAVFYQMRVYNTALSSSDVTTNFNEIKSTYGL
jgi:hypothetical protein